MLRAGSAEVVHPEPISLRPPGISDARAIWSLVDDSSVLDSNSAYAYLLVCSHFAATSLVALDETRVVGFVAGYRPPIRPEALFVWQIAVHPGLRGRGLATRMLGHVIAAPGCRGVRYLEATVTPSNAASKQLFAGFARRVGADLRRRLEFPRDLFPHDGHESEILFRIGPLECLRKGDA